MRSTTRCAHSSQSQRWGTANMGAVVASAQATHERHAGYYAAYYDTLNYTFDARARSGLQRFVEELYALGAIPAVPSVEPEVLVVH